MFTSFSTPVFAVDKIFQEFMNKHKTISIVLT